MSSWIYDSGVAQNDTLPASSVALAEIAVALFSATVTASLKPPVPSASVSPAIAPVQSDEVYKRTVTPALAMPDTIGSGSEAGESGVVPVNEIDAGGVSS